MNSIRCAAYDCVARRAATGAIKRQSFLVRQASILVAATSHRKPFAAQRAMQQKIHDSDTDWTVVQPPKLLTRLDQQLSCGWRSLAAGGLQISRADVQNVCSNNLSSTKWLRTIFISRARLNLHRAVLKRGIWSANTSYTRVPGCGLLKAGVAVFCKNGCEKIVPPIVVRKHGTGSHSMNFTRRDFNRIAGLTALSQFTPATKAQSQNRSIGWCMVGLGRISMQHFMPGLKDTQKGKLTALVSGHSRQAEQQASTVWSAQKLHLQLREL